MSVGIHDDEQDWAVDATHVPVEGLQREAVQLRAVDERPRVADGPGGQVARQLKQRTHFTINTEGLGHRIDPH